MLGCRVVHVPLHDDNVGSQPGHVTPYSQSGSLCAGSDVSRSESVDSDKKGTS